METATEGVFQLRKVYDESEIKKEESPSPEKKNISYNAREISNGWLVCTSWEEEYDDNGHCCSRYKSEEVYYPTNPLK